MGKPSVKFKSWQVGRSPKGTDTNSDEQRSFITSTEEVCYFTASVGYDGNQGDSVSPIDPSKVTWEIVEKPSHGMALDSELQGNWSGAKHPSKLDPSTSFNVVGKLKVPRHKGTSKSHCPNYGGTSTPLNGREDKPMTFTIKFSAKTEDGQDITPVALVFIQDEKDEMRQEYMDMARKTTTRKGSVDGNVLRVPSRSELGSQNTYDDGHYSYMMGRTILPKKHTDWTAAYKKHAKIVFGNTGLSDLVETGGYRNPHHHYYHVPNGSSSPRGWHQFGLALDVRGKDIDIDKDNKEGTLEDRDEIAIAAKKYAGASWTKHTYSDGHVHAQWEWEGSNKERASTSSSGKFSLPPAGTDKPLVVEKKEEKKLLPCGHEEGSPGVHRKSYWRACGHTDWHCLGPMRHNYVRCPRKDNGDFCRTDPRYPGYHLPCDESHVHKYLEDVLTEGPCGHVYKPGSAHAHRSVTCPTQNGKSCSYGSYYACRGEHVHAYPSDPPTDVPRRMPPKETTPTETQTQTRPRAVCSAGHTYNSDRSAAVSRHKDRMCTRCSLTYQNCTNHGTACQNSQWHTEDPSAAPKSPTPTTPTTPSTTPTTPTTPSTDDDDDDTSVPQAPSQPVVSYHACGVHRSSVSGDHSLQASCSTDSKCIATNFYQCMHLVHKYATPPPRTPTDTPRRPKPDPPPPPKSACPADSWTSCGGSSSHAATCSAGHSYYTCASQAWHKDRTCTRCSQTYQDCTNSSSACQSNHWHTDKAIAKVKCGASGWTGCTTSVSSSSEHRTTCSGGHSYWTCGTANDWHKDRTCTRCSQTYQKCTNTSTACQGNKWHTGG